MFVENTFSTNESSWKINLIMPNTSTIKINKILERTCIMQKKMYCVANLQLILIECTFLKLVKNNIL